MKRQLESDESRSSSVSASVATWEKGVAHVAAAPPADEMAMAPRATKRLRRPPLPPLRGPGWGSEELGGNRKNFVVYQSILPTMFINKLPHNN